MQNNNVFSSTWEQLGASASGELAFVCEGGHWSHKDLEQALWGCGFVSEPQTEGLCLPVEMREQF